MRRTEEEEKAKLNMNTTNNTTKATHATVVFEPEDVPLQKYGVILRSHSEGRVKNEDGKAKRNENKPVTTVAPTTPVATVHISTSATSEATVESKSNSTSSVSG